MSNLIKINLDQVALVQDLTEYVDMIDAGHSYTYRKKPDAEIIKKLSVVLNSGYQFVLKGSDAEHFLALIATPQDNTDD